VWTVVDRRESKPFIEREFSLSLSVIRDSVDSWGEPEKCPEMSTSIRGGKQGSSGELRFDNDSRIRTRRVRFSVLAIQEIRPGFARKVHK
jgi:hypothetical protein